MDGRQLPLEIGALINEPKKRVSLMVGKFVVVVVKIYFFLQMNLFVADRIIALLTNLQETILD
ncbi:MAG: hypothetical protein ABIB47_04940 [Candidatus Woesearchaeota archaeon]